MADNPYSGESLAGYAQFAQALVGKPASSASGTTRLTGEAQGTLDELFKSLGMKLKSGQYSKEAAISDATGSTADLVQGLLGQYMPEISGAEKTAGSYSSTTGQMLRGDVAARVSSAAHKNVLDTILGYANIEQGLGQQIIGGAGATGRTVTQDTGKTPGLGEQFFGEGSAFKSAARSVGFYF